MNFSASNKSFWSWEVLSSWRGALLEMREGEKKRVWVPASRPSELEWGKFSERGCLGRKAVSAFSEALRRLLDLYLQYLAYGFVMFCRSWHQNPARLYPWVFELELVKVEDQVPWWVYVLLVSPFIAGELYIQITGETPGDLLNEWLRSQRSA